MNELELDRLEGTIAADPDRPVDDATRRALERGRALPGDAGVRAATLWRIATAATWAANDAARRLPPIRRTEGAFAVAAETRAKLATRLGFSDPWALARAIANEPDGSWQPRAHPERGPEGAESKDAALRAVLAEPGLVAARVAEAHGVRPGIIRVELQRGAAPDAGRTVIVAPGRDVRVRLWWRPEAGARGVLRVLLHELGHAILAAHWGELPFGLAAAPSRAVDEGVAAWTGSLLEREAFLAEVLDVDPAIAATERAIRAARRARLEAAAAAERAFYTAGGPPPWREPLAWTDPGASGSYAAAEAVRDLLDERLGPGWPTASLAPLAALGARLTVHGTVR
jgi:hypothetical protein